MQTAQPVADRQRPVRQATAHTVSVHLADHEWGNEIMLAIANEQLDRNPALENLIVTVYEHAGWFLQYARLDGETLVVGTANDMARFGPRVERFRDLIRDANFVHLSTIRR